MGEGVTHLYPPEPSTRPQSAVLQWEEKEDEAEAVSITPGYLGRDAISPVARDVWFVALGRSISIVPCEGSPYFNQKETGREICEIGRFRAVNSQFYSRKMERITTFWLFNYTVWLIITLIMNTLLFLMIIFVNTVVFYNNLFESVA